MSKLRKDGERFTISTHLRNDVTNFYRMLSNHPDVNNSLKGICQVLVHRYKVGNFDGIREFYEMVKDNKRVYDENETAVQFAITKELSDFYMGIASSPDVQKSRKAFIEYVLTMVADGKIDIVERVYNEFKQLEG